MRLPSTMTIRVQTATGRRTSSIAAIKMAAATVAALFLLVAVSPFAQHWFSAQLERGEVVRYSSETDATASTELQRLLDEADAYNEGLASTVSEDPFANTDRRGEPQAATEMARYRKMLTTPSSKTMATLSIPSIGAILPVYHGSSEQTLRSGVGHIFGSSLPVGGPGTHAVLIGHSGYGHSRLFNDLAELRSGDRFSVEAAGRTLTYAVTSTEVVEPSDVSSLAASPGRDLMTLVTCTPTGVNTHRLLVHAERTAGASDAAGLDATGTRSFPWWFVASGCVIALWTAHAVLVMRRQPSATAAPSHPSASRPDEPDEQASP